MRCRQHQTMGKVLVLAVLLLCLRELEAAMLERTRHYWSATLKGLRQDGPEHQPLRMLKGDHVSIIQGGLKSNVGQWMVVHSLRTC